MTDRNYNFFNLKQTSILKKSIKRNSIYHDSYSTRRDSSFSPFYLLPMIDKNIINKAFQSPSSILTKYIHRHTNELIRATKEDLKRPIKISQTQFFSEPSKKKKKSMIKSRNIKNKKLNLELKKESTDINQNQQPESEKKQENLYITEPLKELNENLQSIPENEENTKIENPPPPPPEIIPPPLQKSISVEDIISQISFNKLSQYPSSLNLNQPLPKEKYEQMNKLFRRVRTFQPVLEENWKSKYGLSIAIGPSSPSPLIENINYQSKLFHEQVKLLFDSIQRYKMTVISKENFMEAFNALSLKSKINFNKVLEEACGLLLLLPQIILLEFYNYVEKFDSMHIPKKEKFIEKYIFDEVENLNYNNNLLTEVSDFFQNCFEVYLILAKEVDNMALKPKKFTNALSAFERIRYNICFAINAAENALNNYNKDIKIIKRLNQESTNNKKYVNYCSYDKKKFISNKIIDRQKKIRIDNVLGKKSDSESKINCNYMGMLRNLKKHKKFKSVVGNELVAKLLKHCKKESKNIITTQRINYELDPDNSEDDEKTNLQHKVIKLSF